MGMAELNAVRRGYRLFETEGRERIARVMPSNFVLRDNVILEGVELKGRTAMLRNLEMIDEAFEDVSWTAMEYRDLGEQVFVRVRFDGKGRASGAPVTIEVAQLWTFRNGKPVRFEVFKTAEEALAAARR